MADPTAIAIVTPEERAQHEREGQGLVVAANAIAIADGDTYTKAAKWLQEILLPRKRLISETFRPRIQQADQLHKGLLADEKRFLAPVLGAERVVRGKIAEYEDLQRQRQREAEEAQQREQARLEAEERARVEAEQRQREADAVDDVLEHAVEAEQRGDVETAKRLIETPVQVEPVAPRPVFAPPPAVVAAPKVEGLSFQDVWDFEITDATAVPREYLVVDDKAIRGVVKAMREKTKIPGVRAFSRRVPSAKAAK